jgi:hypothetical protein
MQAVSAQGALLDIHALPTASLQESLTALATSILADMVSGQQSAIADAEEWAAQSRIAFTEVLAQQLRGHRPRAGEIEEGVRRQRSMELLRQRRQVDQFVSEQSAAINAQVRLLNVYPFCRAGTFVYFSENMLVHSL